MNNQTQTVLKCRVRKSGTGYEGTVSVPGLKPTKLCKRDESTVYANTSGVQSAAKALAERLGFALEVDQTAPKATTGTTTTRKAKTKTATTTD